MYKNGLYLFFFFFVPLRPSFYFLSFRIFIHGPEFGYSPRRVSSVDLTACPLCIVGAHTRARARRSRARALFDSPGDLFTVKSAESELEDTPEHSG